MTLSATKSWLADIFLLCLFIGSCFLFMLGNRPLSVPDESRYSEIPREMLVSHNFITPHINNIVYFEKPPLIYWIQAVSLKAFGLNEWGARLPNALIALLGCLAVYFTARKLYDRKTGLYASVILASSLIYYALARVVTLDMITSVLLSCSLFSFILGVQKNSRYYYGVYIFSGLTVLAKGLIGIIFPGAIIFLWLLIGRQWKTLTQCKLISGTVLFLVITLPWHMLVQHYNPEFFYYYFIKQQFLRYLTMDAGRYQPVWFFVPILALGFFPWAGFLVGAWKNYQKNHPDYLSHLYFLISFLFIFVFFSLSHSKLIPYILPCYPMLAILTGAYFANKPKNFWVLQVGLWTTGIMIVVLICAIWFNLTPTVALYFGPAKKIAYIITGLLGLNLIAIIIWSLIISAKNFHYYFMTQVILALLFLSSLTALLPYIYMDSIKPLALDIKPYLKPNTPVAVYHFYYQDLPFYLNRTVSIVDWKGELQYGEKYLPLKNNTLISDKTLWQEWRKKPRMYLIVPDDFYVLIHKLPYPIYPVVFDRHNTVFTNHPENNPS